MPDIIAASSSPEVLDYLLRRRSVPVKMLRGPGPDEEQIQTILRAASRVPDHGKLHPWHFIVFSGSAREQAGKILRRIWRDQEPEADPAKLELEEGRFMRAPVVIAVVCRLRPGKAPAWEQTLSAGAACQTLCLAANALGFGTNWLTEWYAYSRAFYREISLDERDRIAGFMYIGMPAQQPSERERPDTGALTTFWKPGAALKRGDSYDRADGESSVWGADVFDSPT